VTKPKYLAADQNKSGKYLPVTEFRFPINVLGSAAETDLGEDLPDEGVLLYAYVNVRTAEATAAAKTLAVGLLSTETGGDADGFDTSVSVAATGLVAVTGGALGPLGHILDGVAKSPSVTAAGADFAELVADLHVWVMIPSEVIA